ncbi:FAD-dependent oxidoreductase [Paenibacillus caseinilyticus]|uniref:(2Fe-2S)-binding protein n=1 Tax=Paenibacillus mucilaginosus K02 TaxID=997761 RepID=I0BMZ0_9BACL|nr:FAD-dependent oxidoreductase [Paenibacillus mucilaginosus]AFH63737.1 (2Fe-2S)-binding protein [Paenibacillus mucilaginosus K02]
MAANEKEALTALPQYPESYWLDSADVPQYPKLTQDLHADVVIAGAGITGMLTAYLLLQKGVKVTVIEAGQVLSGTTKHTTAKITAQHDLIYDELISHFGKDKARLYYEANREGLELIVRTAEELGIDCGLTREDAYVYTTSDDYIGKLQAEAKAYEELGIPGGYVEGLKLPFATKGAVVMRNQAQFNPGIFVAELAKEVTSLGGQIFGETTVVKVTPGNPISFTTDAGHKVSCGRLISCSHYPVHDGGQFYFARMHADRSYAVLAKTKEAYPGGMYLSAEEPKRSLRSVEVDGQPMVLFGGESHKSGQGICTFQYYEALQKFGQETFGLEEIAYRWSAQDLTTLDKVPYIGRMGEEGDKRNLLVATGFKKWGMSHSAAAALLNSRLVTGEGSPYEELFQPSRFHADPEIREFAMHNANVAKELISGKLQFPQTRVEELKADEGAVVRIRGRRTGAYRDPQGELYLVDTTCTHMGCEVEWNEAERSWDCPCHGSRFAYNGDVIEGPAKRSLGQVQL